MAILKGVLAALILAAALPSSLADICGSVTVQNDDPSVDKSEILAGLHETLWELTGAAMDSIKVSEADLADTTSPYTFDYCLYWQGPNTETLTTGAVASIAAAKDAIKGDAFQPLLQKRCTCCGRADIANLGVLVTVPSTPSADDNTPSPAPASCLEGTPCGAANREIFKADAGDLSCSTDNTYNDCETVCCEAVGDKLDPPAPSNTPLEATCTPETMFCPLQRSLNGPQYYEMAGLTSLGGSSNPNVPMPDTPSPVQEAKCGLRSYNGDYYFYFFKRECPTTRTFDYANEEVIDVVYLRVPGEKQDGVSAPGFTSITFLGEEAPQSLLNPQVTCVCKSPITAIVDISTLQATTLSPVDVEGTGVFDPTLCLYRKSTYEPQYLVGTGDRFPLLEPRYWLELKAPNPDDVIAFAHCAVSTSWLAGDNRLGLSDMDWDTTGLPSANPTTFQDANGQPAVLFLARSCPYSVVTDFVPEPVENFGGDSWFIEKAADGSAIGFRGKSSAKLSIKNFRFYSYDTVFFTCKVLRCNTQELPESSNSCGRCETDMNYEKGDGVRRRLQGSGNAGATVDVWATTEPQVPQASASGNSGNNGGAATQAEVVSGALELTVENATPFLQAGSAQDALRAALGKVAGVEASQVSLSVTAKNRRRLQGNLGAKLLVNFSIRVPSGSTSAAVIARFQASSTTMAVLRQQIETELTAAGQTQSVVVVDLVVAEGSTAPTLSRSSGHSNKPTDETEQASTGRVGATLGHGLLAVVGFAVLKALA